VGIMGTKFPKLMKNWRKCELTKFLRKRKFFNTPLEEYLGIFKEGRNLN